MHTANSAMHPQVIEYAMPPPKRKAQRHHRPHNYNSLHDNDYQRHHHHHHYRNHHHHHHQYRHNDDYQDQHCHRRHHRRVVSDPGGFARSNSQNVFPQHRRFSSLGGNDHGPSLLQATITEASEDEPSPDETTKTLTFRKVPWHPNLHMLKTRQK
ncbi:uncharacterized histidine-rich protein DDB_G0274557-like [Venturia canescens]|uniref:uncharacterized histidine-rich protein DDB_G0274557-like n=1 Tax=Venturia canescens TaxID=32260 RepID=UPI001C9C0220|nr:uncharacterized histidine-rich protein DDB_G0274557-like [Venturia canescens]